MMKFLSPILLALLSITVCQAQTLTEVKRKIPVGCGADSLHGYKLSSDSTYSNKQNDFEKAVVKAKNTVKPRASSSTIYKMPVVIHIMHLGEAVGTGTNLSNEDIKAGINRLNQYFRKTGLGVGNGVDVEIEFALAVQDENGNCTNAIRRYNMSGNSAYVNNGVNNSGNSGIDDANLKALSRWKDEDYYNIYIVSKIDGNNCIDNSGSYTAGYAYFAAAHGDAIDGMIMLACAYENPVESTLTHELGHALNLYHTFEDDNDGNNCPPSNGNGDYCNDTPRHIRYQNHPEFQNQADNCAYQGTNNCDAGGTQGHMHNYMDYSWDACKNEFSNDQKTRMVTALTTTRASYLKSNGNQKLVAPAVATVDFKAAATVICTGASVQFTDESFCSPNAYTNTPWDNTSFLWTFDNGVNTPITSTLQNPTITFNTNGLYDVTLEITNAHGTTALKKYDYFTVTASPTANTCTPPTGTNVGTFGFVLSNVFLNGIDNTTSSTDNVTYSDFTCSAATNVHANATYTMAVTIGAGSGYGEVVEAFIDWNDNGIFDTNERILSGSTTANTTKTITANVTIPTTAVQNKSLTMRVYAEADALSTAEKTCSSAMFVPDVEDYGIYILPEIITPVANFSASATTICKGSAINFTDASTNTPTSWTWSFTGATTTSSTAQNPSITYNTAGTYQVELTATNAAGSDVETKTAYITVNDVPAKPTTIIGDTLVCTNETGISYSINAVGNSTSYTWTVPNGTTIASGANTNSITVDVNSSTGGTISVKANNSCGSGASTNRTMNVVCTPVANFSASTTTICAGSSINFTDVSTNTPTSWAWSFTGAATTASTAQNPSITYNTAGTYHVELTATNAAGSDVETKTAYITVNDVPAKPTTIIGDTLVCTNETGINYSVNAVGNSTSYTWTLPNGTTIASGANTNSITVDVNSSTGGTINVKANNSCGSGASTNRTMNVVCTPVANFSASATTICAGNSINFTDASTNTPTSWAWSFTGAATTASSSQNPSITYNTAGTYQVELTATNAAGSDVETKTAYITVNDVPNAAGVITGTNTACTNQTGITYSIASVANASSYMWTTPSGTTITTGDNTNSIMLDANTSTGGTITVTPNNGCGDGSSSNVSLTVNDCAIIPVATFTTSATTICIGNTITFTDISSNTPTSWTWDFSGGDITTSPNQNPSVTYSTAGTYQATLTATNSAGSDSETMTITVNDIPANAGTITGAANVCENQNDVTYSITSVNRATSYNWTTPTGTLITNGSNSNTITVAIGTSSGGVLSVEPTNACGTGGSSSITLTVSRCPSAITTTNQSEENILFPNPTNAIAYLHLADLSQIKRISTFDILGNLVVETTNITASPVELNLSKESAGVYVVRIERTDSVEMLRIIKE